MGRVSRGEKRNAFSLAAEADGRGAAARSERDSGADAPSLCAAPEPVLPQGSACELRQARADADVGSDFRGRGDTGSLAGLLLGRELAAGSAAARAVPGGRRDHRAPHVCETRISARPVVSAMGREGRPRWVACVVGTGGGCRARRCNRDRRGRAALAADPCGRRGWGVAARVSRRLPQAVSRRSGAAP